MAMTPQETYDAWMEQITTGDSAAFRTMLDQLYAGELVMEFPPEGTLIRARDPERDGPPPAREGSYRELLAGTGFGDQLIRSALEGKDDGLGEHCGCCAHRRGVGVDPCGGPNCPCANGRP